MRDHGLEVLGKPVTHVLKQLGDMAEVGVDASVSHKDMGIDSLRFHRTLRRDTYQLKEPSRRHKK
jgi:hypothetical protein